MLEESKAKYPDLIDKKEYGKRRRAFFKKNGQIVPQNLNKKSETQDHRRFYGE